MGKCRLHLFWDDNVVHHYEFNTVRGAGVKARGSRNIISNNKIRCNRKGIIVQKCTDTMHDNRIDAEKQGIQVFE